MNRREFLGGAGALAIGATPLLAATRRRAVLGPGDVRHVGAFRLAPDLDGEDAAYSRGFALRRNGGRLHAFLATHRGTLYEVRVPGPSARAPYPLAPLVRSWGRPWEGRMELDGAPPLTEGPQGVFFDESDGRLYWTYGDGYNARSERDPSIGYSVLEAGGRARSFGPWRLAGRSCKMTQGGILALPREFARRNTGGRRLAAGFGGYYSIAAMGPISAGPALAAFSPRDLREGRVDVGGTPLVGYPFHAEPYRAPDRAHRDADYRTEFDGWNPEGGVGYWAWTDRIQAAVWVETPTRHGFVTFPDLGNGRVWYERSSLHAERASLAWMVYDPDDLARVAAGRRQEWQIQPRRSWRVRYPGLPDPLPGWDGDPRHIVTGAAFDAPTRRLFVVVRFGWDEAGSAGHMVHVYRVA